jgi:cytochrome P450
MAERRR